MLSSAFTSLSNSLRSNLRKEKSKSWTSWNQFDVISRLPWFSYNSSHLDCLTSQMVSADTQGNTLRHRFGKDFYRWKGPAATSGISPDDFSQVAGRMWEIIVARRTCGEKKSFWNRLHVKRNKSNGKNANVIRRNVNKTMYQFNGVYFITKRNF